MARSVTYRDFTDQIVTATWMPSPVGHLQIRNQGGQKVGNEPLMTAEGFDRWVAGLRANFPECIIDLPYTRPAARERELLPSEMSMGALVDLRDEITSRIATYRQPGVPVRFEDRVALEAVMAEIEERESRAAVAKW